MEGDERYFAGSRSLRKSRGDPALVECSFCQSLDHEIICAEEADAALFLGPNKLVFELGVLVTLTLGVLARWLSRAPGLAPFRFGAWSGCHRGALSLPSDVGQP